MSPGPASHIGVARPLQAAVSALMPRLFSAHTRRACLVLADPLKANAARGVEGLRPSLSPRRSSAPPTLNNAPAIATHAQQISRTPQSLLTPPEFPSKSPPATANTATATVLTGIPSMPAKESEACVPAIPKSPNPTSAPARPWVPRAAHNIPNASAPSGSIARSPEP